MITNLKIVHLASEIVGGAGIAALRLHEALLDMGISSQFLHGFGSAPAKFSSHMPAAGSNWQHYADRALDRWTWHRHRKGAPLFSRSRRMMHPKLDAHLRQADIIHLHWISKWLDWDRLFASIPHDKPVVMTLHDANFFTGGCHQTDQCDRFSSRCRECPVQKNDFFGDPAARGFKMRESIYHGRSIIPVPNSHWMAEHAARAALFKSFEMQDPIPPGIDTQAFTPLDHTMCRNILGLSANRFIISAGAADLGDPNKGMPMLLKAVETLPDSIRRACTLLTYGGGNLPADMHGIPVHTCGYVASDRLLSVVYSASNVYVTPSKMETFGMTAAEAAACGTPVIAFHTGGLSEAVKDGQTGWLVPLAEGSDGLCHALAQAFEARDARLPAIGEAARADAVARLDIRHTARKYVRLYETILPARRERGNP